MRYFYADFETAVDIETYGVDLEAPIRSKLN